MKISVSVTDSDVEFLDGYARSHAVASRSAVVRKAIWLLRHLELSQHYEAALNEWVCDGEDEVWDAVVVDGLSRG